MDSRGHPQALPANRMSRRDIHYWKCDRPAAFHGTRPRGNVDGQIAGQLQEELQRYFDTANVLMSPAAGEGNHLTWNAEVDGRPLLIRLRPVLHAGLRLRCLPRPRALCVAGLERIAAPDLNHWFKQGALDAAKLADDIGAAVATWQSISFGGFGVLESGVVDEAGPSEASGAREAGSLQGPHRRYADYFHLRLDDHLHFLTVRGFLTNAAEIRAEIENHRSLLDLPQGCLVHKDLALWNILGSRDEIAAFIDFDDAISGDPMDDLSLLACFHDAFFLQRAFEG